MINAAPEKHPERHFIDNMVILRGLLDPGEFLTAYELLLIILS
jgi:hypothetical protein